MKTKNIYDKNSHFQLKKLFEKRIIQDSLVLAKLNKNVNCFYNTIHQ